MQERSGIPRPSPAEHPFVLFHGGGQRKVEGSFQRYLHVINELNYDGLHEPYDII